MFDMARTFSPPFQHWIHQEITRAMHTVPDPVPGLRLRNRVEEMGCSPHFGDFGLNGVALRPNPVTVTTALKPDIPA